MNMSEQSYTKLRDNSFHDNQQINLFLSYIIQQGATKTTNRLCRYHAISVNDIALLKNKTVSNFFWLHEIKTEKQTWISNFNMIIIEFPIISRNKKIFR